MYNVERDWEMTQSEYKQQANNIRRSYHSI